MTTTSSNIVLCYFKIAYTNNTLKYPINKDWTLSYFINTIKEETIRVYPNFCNLNINNFCLVETGKQTKIICAEEAEPVENDNETTLFDKYGSKINTISFYIRFYQSRFSPLQNNNNNYSIINRNDYTIPIVRYNNNNNNNNSLNNCPICLENTNDYFGITGCNHEICCSCYVSCRNTNNLICPICRQGRLINHLQTP